MVPALAVVVGVFAGCGGSSGGEMTTSASQGTDKTIEQATESGRQAGSGASTSRAAGDSQGRSSFEGNDSSAGSGKHGPHVASPKGPREQEPTPKEIAQATVASMTLASPSLPSGVGSMASLSSTDTCDGKDSWPALAWQGVPQGTAELALFAMNVQPVAGKLFFDWAVAGIDPALTGIEASKLPTGAVVGENSFGKRAYSICPPPGSSETYMFALYALPKELSAERGFDPGVFRQQVLAISGSVGLLPVSYGRD